MTVTFSVEQVYDGRCEVISYPTGEDNWQMDSRLSGPFSSYNEAQTFVVNFQENHWDHYITRIGDLQNSPELNMSNANTREILMALDLPWSDDESLVGSEAGHVFKERVLIALATDRLDDGVPGFSEKVTGGPTFVYGGREAGYVDRCLQQLLAVAECAAQHNRKVLWG